jgi:hypothetical protein
MTRSESQHNQRYATSVYGSISPAGIEQMKGPGQKPSTNQLETLLIMKDLRNDLRGGRNVGVLATAIWPTLSRIVAIPRLPGFTNCKPKYKKPDALFPVVCLKSQSGEQYPMAEAFVREITQLYEAREQEREARRLQASLSPQKGRRLSNLSLERFRTSGKYQDRPAAADIAFCVAAYAHGMDEARIERALEDDYLSRDPSPSKRASYIRRTMTKARDRAIR